MLPSKKRGLFFQTCIDLLSGVKIKLMSKKLKLIGNLYVFIFVVWGLYRLIFRLPEAFEEIVLKPLVWLGPTFYIVFVKEKRGFSSLGYTKKSFLPGIKKGLLFGIVFFIVGLSINYLKNSGVSFVWENNFLTSLALVLITAISEETVFRGYIQNRLEELCKNSWLANIIASIGFCLVYLPISVLVYRYNIPQVFIFLVLVFLSSFGSGIFFSWTKGIWASILIHVFWSWPLLLFK